MHPSRSRALLPALVALLVGLLGLGLAPAQATTGTPSVPLNVTAKAGSGRSVTITWGTPADGGTSPIQSYVVAGTSPDLPTATVSAGTHSKTFDLSSVPVSTGISFTVTAHNALGDGATSAPTTPFNLPATVPGAPTSVKVSQDAPGDDPVVTWTFGSLGGSPVTMSTVTVEPGDQVISVDGDATEASVPGLTPGTKYTFAVIVSNEVGNSKPTYADPFTPWAAPDPVTGLKAVRAYQSASLSWTRSVTHGRAVTAYKITIMPGGGYFTVPGTNSSAKVTGLHNGTRYTATVEPVIGSVVFPGTTSPGFVPAGSPGPPYVLAVSPGRGRVTLKWATAFTNGDPIRRYVLEGSNGFLVRDLGPGVRQFVVRGLHRGQKIKFRMRSVNGYGASPWGGWTQTVKVR